MARRQWGNIRKRNSGRWQIQYTNPDGKLQSGGTFSSKADAAAHLAQLQVEIDQQSWVNPTKGKVLFEEYAQVWLASRQLRDTTLAKYEGYLKLHILPTFGVKAVANITSIQVRQWNAQLGKEKPVTAAGSYRLLSAVMKMAVEDRIIVVSPCIIKGAGTEHSPERPVISVGELLSAAEAMRSPYQLAVLLAACCQLRRGEVLGLQRQDLDPELGRLRVRRSVVVTSAGKILTGPPKTEAGVKDVEIPARLLDQVRSHLAASCGPDPSSLLFPSEHGNVLSPRTFDRYWDKARNAIGRGDLRFHDLRHSGLTWAAESGASLAQIKRQGGHSSTAAAMRYQHATDAGAKTVADHLDRLLEEAVDDEDSVKESQESCPPVARGFCLATQQSAVTYCDLVKYSQPQRDSNPCLHLERVVS